MDNAVQGRTVSLVLGSGGARGLAQVGVIRWLVDNGYRIRSIAGSSMGAVVGAVFASGKLDRFAEWVLALERTDVLSLLDPAFNRAGLFKGERIMAALRTLIGDGEIRELPVAFTAVAMDLESGKEIWLREGSLFDAVRASIAIPMLFTPVQRDGLTLVDGGLVNPVPLAPTLNDRTDLTVAVNCGGRHEEMPAPEQSEIVLDAGSDYRRRILAFLESLQTSRETGLATPDMINVGLRSMEAMENTIARFKLAANAPDVLIELPRNACRIHEFWRAEEMIALGQERAARAFETRAG